MEDPLDLGRELREQIDSHLEWLLVRENGKTFSLRSSEIEITGSETKLLLGVIDDAGAHTLRVQRISAAGKEIEVAVTAQFGRSHETLRFVPRTPAKEMSLEVELARLAKANEIARMLAESIPPARLKRVALNAENGRIAQIDLETGRQAETAIADVTQTLSPESVLASAAVSLREIQKRRKRPPARMRIICEKKQARVLRKLHALLNDRQKARFVVCEVARRETEPKIDELRPFRLPDLWREKARKLSLPPEIGVSRTAKRIIDLAPEAIDVIFSKQGETLRLRGLPFARVRTMAGNERAWFGVERSRRLLTDENWNEFAAFVEDIAGNRHFGSPNRRHHHYRIAPEAWLESILRRNIKLLDENLILSPLYNQFRTASDKIDLLALRRDGRLVIIELKTSPDREMIFQAADYWRKIELQRRRGELRRARIFGDLEILDRPALVYAVAPSLSFHYDFGEFAAMLSKEIELWRFELHENWRQEIKVLARRNYSSDPLTNL